MKDVLAVFKGRALEALLVIAIGAVFALGVGFIATTVGHSIAAVADTIAVDAARAAS